MISTRSSHDSIRSWQDVAMILQKAFARITSNTACTADNVYNLNAILILRVCHVYSSRMLGLSYTNIIRVCCAYADSPGKRQLLKKCTSKCHQIQLLKTRFTRLYTVAPYYMYRDHNMQFYGPVHTETFSCIFLLFTVLKGIENTQLIT